MAPATPATAEDHLSFRAGWLRAAVLGANDGILSTSSLLLGVAGSGASGDAVLTAGAAGLVAGALSMAAGEFVSVSSQRDTEDADLALERHELEVDPAGELAELAAIYEARGLPAHLALEVAEVLTAKDALGAHARDELGLGEDRRARPLQAAWSSAAAFAAGAALPMAAVAVGGAGAVGEVAIVVVTLLALATLGFLGASLGGAPRGRAAARVVGWGVAAMTITYAIGALVGTAV